MALTDRLRFLPGVRFNYDHKDVDFDQQVYGGLQTTDPALIALQLSILAPQAYKANVSDANQSGQLTLAYKVARSVNAYATYATGFKSVGLNLNGVPTDASNQPVLAAATVKPEDTRNVEVGLKTEPLRGVTANISAYNTEIRNFQTQVTNGSVGVIRGYLANAEKARVRGAEFDGAARVGSHSSIYGAAAYTDGKYVTFKDAPPPLEDTGGPQFKDISGSILPGISKWALSLGGEYRQARNGLRPVGSLLRRPRRQLPIVVLVERQVLQVPGRRWIRPAERPPRFQGSGWLDDLVVVPQPSEPGLLRAAHRGAGEHRPLRRAARRSTDNRRDVEGSVEGGEQE